MNIKNTVVVLFIWIQIFIVFSAKAKLVDLREGGVSGGGGNVICPKPPEQRSSPDEVERVIRNSLVHVKNYFLDAESDYRNGLSSKESSYQEVFKKLFESKVNVHRAVDQVFPEVEEHRPCYDLEFQPVDASFKVKGHSISDAKICMSAYNLSKKLDRDELEAQTIALMVHEYVEVVGLGEEDAILLQKKVLQDLRGL